MHDPSTVAFEIRSPIKRKSQWFPKGYRSPLITVWHEGPLRFAGKLGCRDDDSCGWSRPPYTAEQRDRMQKLGRQQYSQIFEKQVRTREGASYAHVCYEPNTYDAIYWAWRAINHSEKKQGVWQYGRERNALTAQELETIFSLASNPVDNLRMSVAGVNDEEAFVDFFMTVFRCWQRFNRPWYKHPRWHFWHWRFQIHPLQKLSRRLFTRCEECGKPFGWNESPVGTWGGDKVWHSACFPSPTARVASCDSREQVFRAMPVAAPDPQSHTKH